MKLLLCREKPTDQGLRSDSFMSVPAGQIGMERDDFTKYDPDVSILLL